MKIDKKNSKKISLRSLIFVDRWSFLLTEHHKSTKLYHLWSSKMSLIKTTYYFSQNFSWWSIIFSKKYHKLNDFFCLQDSCEDFAKFECWIVLSYGRCHKSTIVALSWVKNWHFIAILDPPDNFLLPSWWLAVCTWK